MITAVDTSVILDILTASSDHLVASLDAFKKCREEGKLILCPIVWGELRPFFSSQDKMTATIEKMSLGFDDFGKEAAARAGELWQRYRKTKGSRLRILGDFMIGAHAQLKADRLLTRDRGFYRDYFRGLKIIEPEK